MKKETKKKKNRKKASRFGKLLLIFLILGLVGTVTVFTVNASIVKKEKPLILTEEEAAGNGGADCILILGCGVRNDGTPSDMLTDRLTVGLRLWQAGASAKILVSGDHGREGYDEVNTMKKWLTDRGVPSEAVFMDHAGFSTYESMYRAQAIFQAKKIVVVTQEYHLYRALYDAERLGLEAAGVPADLNRYAGQKARDLREILARNKDLLYCLFRPQPKYLGDPIPLTGDGNATNDKPIYGD